MSLKYTFVVRILDLKVPLNYRSSEDFVAMCSHLSLFSISRFLTHVVLTS